MDTRSDATRTATLTAQTPSGVNHVVLNVRDLETSHRFWTEVVGFRCVAQLRPKPGRTLRMRFYSGVDDKGDVTHHDLALAQVNQPIADSAEPWGLDARRVGLNHVAIRYPDRDSWLRQLEFLKARGIAFHLRINHGMTHSVYVSDPDGHGIEMLYELPREIWEGDIEAAQNYSERLPTEGEASLVDDTQYPRFGATR